MTLLKYAPDLSFLLLKPPGGSHHSVTWNRIQILTWPAMFSSYQGPTSSPNSVSCCIPPHPHPSRSQHKSSSQAWHVFNPVLCLEHSSSGYLHSRLFLLPKNYLFRETFFDHSISGCYFPIESLHKPVPPSYSSQHSLFSQVNVFASCLSLLMCSLLLSPGCTFYEGRCCLCGWIARETWKSECLNLVSSCTTY